MTFDIFHSTSVYKYFNFPLMESIAEPYRNEEMDFDLC